MLLTTHFKKSSLLIRLLLISNLISWSIFYEYSNFKDSDFMSYLIALKPFYTVLSALYISSHLILLMIPLG